MLNTVQTEKQSNTEVPISIDPLFNDLKKLIMEVAEIDELSHTKSFVDAGIDSMMAMEIVFEVQDVYGLTFSDDEIQKLTNLEQVHQAVAQKMAVEATA